uniref:Uncharacterized protein n=1 Tax=Arundo donax TaxID=35708 RepID=A0A0A8Z8N3_ARUDO
MYTIHTSIFFIRTQHAVESREFPTLAVGVH